MQLYMLLKRISFQSEADFNNNFYFFFLKKNWRINLVLHASGITRFSLLSLIIVHKCCWICAEDKFANKWLSVESFLVFGFLAANNS